MSGLSTANMDTIPCTDLQYDRLDPVGQYFNSSVWDEPSILLKHEGVTASTPQKSAPHDVRAATDDHAAFLHRRPHPTEPTACDAGAAISTQDMNSIPSGSFHMPSMHNSVAAISRDLVDPRFSGENTALDSASSRIKLKVCPQLDTFAPRIVMSTHHSTLLRVILSRLWLPLDIPFMLQTRVGP